MSSTELAGLRLAESSQLRFPDVGGRRSLMESVVRDMPSTRIQDRRPMVLFKTCS